MTTPKQEIDAYLQGLPDNRREDLTQLRVLILQTVPDAEEIIAYKMPGVRIHDQHVLCSYKSQKHYMSLYVDPEIVDQYRDQLGSLDCGRSCIRFKHFTDLPLEPI